MANNRLEIVVAGDTRALNQSLGEARKATDDMVGNIVQRGQQASLALGALTAAGGALAAGFLEKAAQMEQFKAQLTAITGSAEEAQKQLQFMTDFAAKTPFDLPGVVEAGIKLRSLGQDSEKYLPIAGNMAAAMGRTIPDAALALGKAMSGSQDGIQIMADSFGITRAEMAKYGAEADKSGSIQTKTAAQIDKLKESLEQIIKTKFGNSMEEQAKTLTGAMSNLGDSMGQLQASLGKEIAPTAQAVARALTEVVDSFKNMNPYMKTIIANGVLFGTVMTAVIGVGVAIKTAYVPAATFMAAFAAATKLSTIASTDNAVAAATAAGAKALQAQGELAAAAALVEETAAAALNATTTAGAATAAEGMAIAEGELAIALEASAVANAELTAATATATTAIAAEGTAATVTGAAMAFMLSPMVLIIGALGLVAAGLVLATKYIEENTAAQEAQIAVSKRQLKSLHEQRDSTEATRQAIKQWGDDTVAAVAQVRQAMAALGKDDLDLTHAIAGNGEILRKLRQDAQDLEDNDGSQADKDRVAAEIAKYERIVEVQTKARHSMRGMHDAEVKEAAEKVEAAKKVQTAWEALLKTYDEKDKNNLFDTSKEQLAALDKVMAGMKHDHARFRELQIDRLKLVKEIAKEEEKEGEKARKEQIAAEEHKLALIVGNDRASMVARVAILQQFVKDHRLTVDERRKAEVDLARETLSITNLDAATKKKHDEDLKKAAEDRKKKKEAADKKAAEDAEKATKAEEEKAKKAGERDAKDADTNLHRAKQEEDAAKKSFELDIAQYDTLKKKMEERQKLEREALITKARAAAINADPADKERIMRDLNLDMVDLAGKQTEEARRLTDEKQKQLDLLKDIKKEIADFTLGNMTEGAAGAGDYSAFDVKKQGQKAKDDKAAALEKAKKDAGSDAAIMAAILAEMQKQTGALEAIRTTPVKVSVTGAAGGAMSAATSAGDFKTTTNKTGA